MKKIFLYSCILVFLLTGCINQQTDNLKILKINNKELKVEVADTSELRYQGLSGRDLLPDNQGMLFVFDNYTRPSFVMRNMKFALDMIWIKDDKIVGIEKNVQIDNQNNLKRYFPPEPINYVIEVNAEWSEKNKIKVGDKVEGI